MNSIIKFLLTASVISLITACGGGGTPGYVSNVKVEGAWQGNTSNNYALNLISLENNEFYTIFGINNGGDFLVYGFGQGSTVITGNSINGSFREYPNGANSYSGIFRVM